MMPPEPLVPSVIPPSPIWQPTVQELATDAGNLAQLYGQTPTRQEEIRQRQGGGQAAASMLAKDWADRVALDELNQIARAVAEATHLRAQPPPHGTRRHAQPPSPPVAHLTVDARVTCVRPNEPRTSPQMPELWSGYSSRSSEPTTSSKGDTGIGVGGGITVLIFTAIFCGVPWHAYLATNTGDALGHLFWVVWSLVAIPVAIFGVAAGLHSIFES
jgi:hypothetical protein